MQLFLFFLCADPNADQFSISHQKVYQKTCMRHFMDPAIGLKAAKFTSLVELFITNQVENVCEWRGVGCTEGLITSLFVRELVDSRGQHHLADIRWLPPTTRLLSLKYIHLLEGWTIAGLPRELRMIHLEVCPTHLITRLMDDQIRLADLPPRIEEVFFVQQSSDGLARVHLDNLPKTLRRLYISGMRVQSVYVAFEGLPSGLEQMCFVSTLQKKVKFRGTGAKQADARVKNKDMWVEMKRASHYHEFFA